MKKVCLLLVTALFLCLMYSCEGELCADGTICDIKTKKPIDSVRCAVLSGTQVEFSDSIGKYSVCNDFGGCVPKCPDIEIEFSKTGYETKVVTNPKPKDVIYLKKVQ